MSQKSICLVAGEPSGDLHASLLIAEIAKRQPGWNLWGVGASRMADAGCELWQDSSEWAVMGFSEVLRSLWKFRKRLDALTDEITSRCPDGVILIDYPGFNLKLARRLHDAGIPVLYYIVPQLWAWGKGRIEIFRRCIDRTIVVFPFEKDYFESKQVPADWIGHPFVDTVRPTVSRSAFRQSHGIGSGDALIAMMPGVRTQDFRMHMPLFDEALKRVAEQIPNAHGIVGTGIGTQNPATEDLLKQQDLPATDDVYSLLAAADVVLTKTGTTTVEAALLGTPMVTAYRTGRINYAIARSLVDIPFIAMPNLIANRAIVPELIQTGATPETVAAEAIRLLTSDTVREKQQTGLAEVREKLGPPGSVGRAAEIVEQWLAR